jgi:hypothetical protein
MDILIGGIWQFNWIVLCTLCSLIGLFTAVLVHMAGKALNVHSLEAWAKSEYMQTAVSLLIVLFAISMVQVGGNVITQITANLAAETDNIQLIGASTGNIGDPVAIAKSYLLTGPLQCETTMYKWARALNFWAEMGNAVSWSSSNVEGLGGSYFYAGRVSATHYAAQNLAYLGLFQFIQYHLLDFSQYTMLQIFLPIGLILRNFAPTRGTGGFMIAFALGFAFVFPASYLMILAVMPSNAAACTNIGVTPDVASAAARTAYANEFLTEDPCMNNAGSIVMHSLRADADTGKEDEILQLLKSVGSLYSQAVFYPMVCLIITFTFVRQTSSLFGADLAEIGRGLIKII